MIWSFCYFVLAFVADLALFRLSRQIGVIPILMAPLVPLVCDLITSPPQRDRQRQWWLGLWDRSKCLFFAMLAIFHWYVIPFVYGFAGRGEWFLEAVSELLMVAVQVITVILLRSGFHWWKSRNTQIGKSPAIEGATSHQ